MLFKTAGVATKFKKSFSLYQNINCLDALCCHCVLSGWMVRKTTVVRVFVRRQLKLMKTARYFTIWLFQFW